MANTARVEASDSGKIQALLIWDQRESEGRGGAADLADLARSHAGILEIINPVLEAKQISTQVGGEWYPAETRISIHRARSGSASTRDRVLRGFLRTDCTQSYPIHL